MNNWTVLIITVGLGAPPTIVALHQLYPELFGRLPDSSPLPSSSPTPDMTGSEVVDFPPTTTQQQFDYGSNADTAGDQFVEYRYSDEAPYHSGPSAHAEWQSDPQSGGTLTNFATPTREYYPANELWGDQPEYSGRITRSEPNWKFNSKPLDQQTCAVGLRSGICPTHK